MWHGAHIRILIAWKVRNQNVDFFFFFFLQNHVNFYEAAQTLNVVNFCYCLPLSIYIAKLLLSLECVHCS